VWMGGRGRMRGKRERGGGGSDTDSYKKKMEWWRNKARFVRRRIVCSYCNVNFVGYSEVD